MRRSSGLFITILILSTPCVAIAADLPSPPDVALVGADQPAPEVPADPVGGTGDGATAAPSDTVAPAVLPDAVTPPPVPTAVDVGMSRNGCLSLPGGEIAPPGRRGATVARFVMRTALFRAPGGRRRIGFVQPTTSFSGQGTILAILGGTDAAGESWIRVLLPRRPNGLTGWVRRTEVCLRRTRFAISVDRRRRLLVARKNGRVVHRSRIDVGQTATPTPSGLYAVYEKYRPDLGREVFGEAILSLTGHSTVFRRFGGGDARLAIHGRRTTLGAPGTAYSFGCVRLARRSLLVLAKKVPVGTPVWIW